MDLLVVLWLPAAVALGVVVTIGHFPVYPGCLNLRTWLALGPPTWSSRTGSPVRMLSALFPVPRTRRLKSLVYPGPTP